MKKIIIKYPSLKNLIPEKHIKMMETFGEYKINDLINEVTSTEVITKLVYLLDLFPKFIAKFYKALRLTEGK